MTQEPEVTQQPGQDDGLPAVAVDWPWSRLLPVAVEPHRFICKPF